MKLDPLFAFIDGFAKTRFIRLLGIFIVAQAIMLRVIVGLGRYSGYNDPPYYGDYEA